MERPESVGVHALEGDGLYKIYNKDHPRKPEVVAVEEMSFHAAENEFLVVVGPSGCGKTTFLRIIAGLVEADEGELLERGEVVMGPSINRALVFQQFNLFPWRTVEENVEFGLEMNGRPKAERRDIVHEYISLVGLSGFEDHYIGELSGGMQQRVGLARALAVDPDILLMDEPFGALDAQTRERMQRELLEIWEREKKTILFVTHDIDEAIFLADRILVMGINPRNIIAELDVPFERPRYDRNIAVDPRFGELKEEIRQVLEIE